MAIFMLGPNIPKIGGKHLKLVFTSYSIVYG